MMCHRTRSNDQPAALQRTALGVARNTGNCSAVERRGAAAGGRGGCHPGERELREAEVAETELTTGIEREGDRRGGCIFHGTTDKCSPNCSTVRLVSERSASARFAPSRPASVKLAPLRFTRRRLAQRRATDERITPVGDFLAFASVGRLDQQRSKPVAAFACLPAPLRPSDFMAAQPHPRPTRRMSRAQEQKIEMFSVLGHQEALVGGKPSGLRSFSLREFLPLPSQ